MPGPAGQPTGFEGSPRSTVHRQQLSKARERQSFPLGIREVPGIGACPVSGEAVQKSSEADGRGPGEFTASSVAHKGAPFGRQIESLKRETVHPRVRLTKSFLAGEHGRLESSSEGDRGPETGRLLGSVAHHGETHVGGSQDIQVGKNGPAGFEIAPGEREANLDGLLDSAGRRFDAPMARDAPNRLLEWPELTDHALVKTLGPIPLESDRIYPENPRHLVKMRCSTQLWTRRNEGPEEIDQDPFEGRKGSRRIGRPPGVSGTAISCVLKNVCSPVVTDRVICQTTPWPLIS
jgi:hypothetical protein